MSEVNEVYWQWYVTAYLPWLLSAITIWMTLLAGNKTKWAWVVGLGNQALWMTWILASQSWGLIPMCVALTFVYARNHLKWSNPEPIPGPRIKITPEEEGAADDDRPAGPPTMFGRAKLMQELGYVRVGDPEADRDALCLRSKAGAVEKDGE